MSSSQAVNTLLVQASSAIQKDKSCIFHDLILIKIVDY